MVSRTERDDGTWYECEVCGMLFETREEATEHETRCGGDEADPTYIQ